MINFKFISFIFNFIFFGNQVVAQSLSSLQNYWRFNSNYQDSITGLSLINYNGSLVPDRFGVPNSAVQLSNGYYLKAPSDVYFNGDFTFSCWVKFSAKYVQYARIFDFGNAAASDNVIFFEETSFSQAIGYTVYNFDQNNELLPVSSESVQLDTWYMISVVQKGNIATIYYNGIAKGSGTVLVPRNVVRTINYFGKSNWSFDPSSNLVLDDAKIWNKALNSTEILQEYSSSLTKTSITTSTSTTTSLPTTSSTTITTTTSTTSSSSSTTITTTSSSTSTSTTSSSTSTTSSTLSSTSISTSTTSSSSSTTITTTSSSTSTTSSTLSSTSISTSTSTLESTSTSLLITLLTSKKTTKLVTSQFRVINNSSLKPLGCFRDQHQRDLDGIYFDNSKHSSQEKCVEQCTNYNFKYAGVQYGYQCWCGNEFNLYGIADNCNMLCLGNINQVCGGAWANYIFETEVNNESLLKKTVCKDKLLNLECPSGLKIKINNAMYGRVSQFKCRPLQFQADKCVSNNEDTIRVLRQNCEGKNKCDILVNEKLFENPCKNVDKYLDVDYECV